MNKKILILFTLVTSVVHQAYAEGGQHLFVLSGQSNMTPSLSAGFQQSVEKVLGKDKVIAVRVGWPSQPIKMWHKAWVPPEGMQDPSPDKNGTTYDTLIKSTQKVISGKQIDSVTFIWMQGEEDARMGWGSVYEKSFNGVLEQLKQDLNVTEINYVVGRINDYWTTGKGLKDGDLVRATLVKLGEAGPNAAWINTDDLNKGVNPWGGYDECDGHYSPHAYRVIGQRFARKACLLIDPNMKLEESVFTEVFFDSAEQVKTHAAIGKSIKVKASDIKADEKKPGMEALLDGRFANPEATGKGWIAFPANDASVELVVDLGEVMPIESTAVSLLGSPGVTAFPKKMTFSISEDGKTYRVLNSRHNGVAFTVAKPAQEAFQDKTRKPWSVPVLTDQAQTPARFIKIEIVTAEEKVMVDEVIVNPKG
jgi:hypothetical protein